MGLPPPRSLVLSHRSIPGYALGSVTRGAVGPCNDAPRTLDSLWSVSVAHEHRQKTTLLLAKYDGRFPNSDRWTSVATIGVNALQTLGSSPFLLFPPSSLPFPLLLPFSLPLTQLGGLGEHLDVKKLSVSGGRFLVFLTDKT